MVKGFLRRRTRTRDNNCHSAQQQVSWITRLLRWFITLDQVAESTNNYESMTNVTNYMFFIGGRLRTVTNTKFLSALVLMLVTIPMVLFSIFETQRLWHSDYGYKVLVVFFYYFWTLCFVSFIKTATTDPGVLPRNVHVPSVENDYEIPQEYYNMITLPTENPLIANIEVKYCTTCRIWRPPRASHCSTCEACIITHDHHCKWVNNCIGQRNYHYFFTFLVSCVIATAFIIANCAIHVSRSVHAKDAPVAILLLIYCGLVVCYPFILLVYHIFLTGSQQTTREYLKSIGSKNPIFHKISSSQDNPFQKGSFLANMFSLILEPRGLSMVSARKKHSTGDWRFINLPQPHSFKKV